MTDAFSERLSGRSVFVTGHTGFKGAWLSRWLARAGARVTGYSLAPPTSPSVFAAANVRQVLHAHHEADVRDAAALHEAVRDAAPEVVFHLAAQSLVRESYRTPRETFDVNGMGTVNLLEAVRRLDRACVVVVVTSDKCYESKEKPCAESDALGGHDPYSASKAVAEIAAAAYRRSFAAAGMRIATARAGNVIGGGDWAEDRIVPDAMRALSAGKPVPIRNPGAVRPWQHVLEPLSGYLTLATRMLSSDDANLAAAWNFGPGAAGEIPVAELIQLVLSEWGEGKIEDASDPNAPREAPALRLATDKARTQLGWKPRWDVANAVHRTVDWYRAFYRRQAQLDEHTDAQIADYEG